MLLSEPDDRSCLELLVIMNYLYLIHNMHRQFGNLRSHLGNSQYLALRSGTYTIFFWSDISDAG